MTAAQKGMMVLIAALLGGCASTPADVTSTTPWKLSGKLPPDQYARCLIKNAEGITGSLSGREDPPEQPGWRKVMIRHDTAGVSVIADIAPLSNGSNVTLWLSLNHFMVRDTMVEMLTKGC